MADLNPTLNNICTVSDESRHDSTYVKVTLLLIAAVSVHLSLSPPNPPAPPKQCIAKRSFFERCVRRVTFCSKALVWLATICDAIATILTSRDLSVALQSPSPYALALASPRRISLLCKHPISFAMHNFSRTDPSIPLLASAPHFLLSPSPLFVLGVISVTLGALLRLWCFRSLGQYFTFELSIHPSHSLVTTGPYALVRHPSYTGIYLTLLGGTLVGLAPGTWLYEYWLGPLRLNSVTFWTMSSGSTLSELSASYSFPIFGLTPATLFVYILVIFWSVKVWYALRSTNRRLQVEDEELHKVFGDVWEEYAEKVRWKLLPGVF
ncbi:unnamed protein product [Somion occarium]|uniref:Protein-S-isoprenylcysteine O-methyltransferase n=1 Tax=Somion occarium TaxID=3059160 RepID=A0ABP1DS76_9APHY